MTPSPDSDWPTPMLWRRLDVPGHDFAQLVPSPNGGWRLSGVALFAYQGQPCRLDYVVLGDASGSPSSAAVSGSLAGVPVRRAIAATPDGRWTLDGSPQPALDGLRDLDLAFSPATNQLCLRRLNLQPGQQADVTAAWLRFPELTLVPLPQRYRRVDDCRYAYESFAPSPWATTLTVAADGAVVDYPELWQAENANAR